MDLHGCTMYCVPFHVHRCEAKYTNYMKKHALRARAENVTEFAEAHTDTSILPSTYFKYLS